MTAPIYAIGDIHGQLDELKRVLDLILADGGEAAQIVFLGDYVDRGPDSKSVIDLLCAGMRAGRNWTAVRGNHDRYFSRFLNDKSVHDLATRSDLGWINPRLGGDKTLLSYGVHATEIDPVNCVHQAACDAVPTNHRDWLAALPNLHVSDHHIFVHAGLRPGIALEHQQEDDLIWIREKWLNGPHDFGKLVVHGHTAVERPEHHGYRINLDTGAGYFRRLTAAVFKGPTVHLLTDKGRIPLPPP